MFRPNRDEDRPVRFLDWRIRLAGAGAILALFGIGADVEVLRWAALAVLAGAAALSVVAARTGGAADAGDGDDEHAEAG